MGKGTVFDGLTDAAWAPLCRRVQSGERAAEVAAQAGVKLAALYRAQRRLGLRVADLPPEARAQRRRRAPRFEDRADDYRYRPGDLCEGDWRRCAALYADGWSSEALGRLFGRCDSVIRRGMRLRRVARKPTSERTVKAPPRGLDVPPRPSADPEVRAACAVELDPDDLVASLAASDAAKARAAQVGLPQAVGLLCNMDVAMVRAAKARGRLALLRPGGFAGSPCPEGEGEAGWAEHGVVLHPHQRAPEGAWATWLMLGGRGAGKTFAGAWWLAEQAMRLGAGGRLALVGATLHDVREVMVEGASGLVGLPRWTRADGSWDGPVYEAGRRRVRFPGGAYAYAFSAEDADSLRGPQFHAAWADEFCAWAGDPGRTLAVLRAGLRLTSRSRLAETGPLRPCGPLPPEGEETPRLVVTTTPRPMRALRELRAEPGFVESRAGTRANAEHLAAGFVEGLERLYGGTRWEAQELEGRIVELDGALWTAELLAGCRGTGPERAGLQRVVVAVDPSATAGGNACGIVAAGRNGLRAWVLADRSCAGLSPGKWADRVAAAVREFDAACVVVEVNQGGEMVREVLRASGVSAAVREVRAVRGKRFRAEPVAALYEQGRVMHAGRFGALEEELMAMGTEDEGRHDLDRADALVWAVTDLLIDRAGERPRPRVRAL